GLLGRAGPRRGADRAARQGLSLARPRQRDPDTAHRLLLGRSARGTADQVRERRRARALRREGGLSDQRALAHIPAKWPPVRRQGYAPNMALIQPAARGS